MRKTSQTRGIMFDMDNTLLKSRIDFQMMKKHVAEFLTANELLQTDFPFQEHTTATMMEYVKQRGISHEVHAEMMEIVAQHEHRGMEDADLEDQVTELLNRLKTDFVLAIVTNNAYKAAVQALDTTGIHHYFDLIIGREQMTAMKPSPSGYLYVKQQFPHIRESEWLSVGDSWIDGKASIDAGLPFISYGPNGRLMEEKGIIPMAHIDNLLQLLDYV